jgi:cell division transport system ATP-binding protein
VLRFEGVTKVYGSGQEVLRGVDLDLDAGEFAFLLGRSGAGKSTLLRLVYREEQPTAGRVWVGGLEVGTLADRAVPFLRRRIGVVFQDGRLLAEKTVWDNVAYPLLVADAPARESFRRIADTLRMVGLAHRAWNLPGALSGGERQRVAIARAIVADPLVLLADEPTGNLDPRNAQQVMEILLEVSRRGTTVLVATHAHELVERSAERVLTLEDGRLTEGWAGVPRPAVPRPAAAPWRDLVPWPSAAGPHRAAVPLAAAWPVPHAPVAPASFRVTRIPYAPHAAPARPAAAVAHAGASPAPTVGVRPALARSTVLREAAAPEPRSPAAALAGARRSVPPRRPAHARRAPTTLWPSRRLPLPGRQAWLPAQGVTALATGLRDGVAALLRLAAVARRTASDWTPNWRA